MLTLQQLAGELAVSTRTVRRWRERGYVTLVRLPTGRLRAEESELARLRAEVTTSNDAEGE